MNMHGNVVNVISAVNPQIKATVLKSTGYTTNADGNQVPSYAAPVTGLIQMQGLVEREYAVLEHTDGFNMSAVNRKMYAYGSLNMLIRTLGEGGDIIQTGTAPNVSTWKVVRVWETWPDWCSVIVRQQIDTP